MGVTNDFRFIPPYPTDGSAPPQGRKYLTNEERAQAEGPDQDGVVTQKVRKGLGRTRKLWVL